MPQLATFGPASLSHIFRIASPDVGVLSVIGPVAPILAEAAPSASMEVESWRSATYTEKICSKREASSKFCFRPQTGQSLEQRSDGFR